MACPCSNKETKCTCVDNSTCKCGSECACENCKAKKPEQKESCECGKKAEGCQCGESCKCC